MCEELNDSIGNIGSDAGFVTQAVVVYGKKRDEMLAEMMKAFRKMGSVSLDRCALEEGKSRMREGNRVCEGVDMVLSGW